MKGWSLCYKVRMIAVISVRRLCVVVVNTLLLICSVCPFDVVDEYVINSTQYRVQYEPANATAAY